PAGFAKFFLKLPLYPKQEEILNAMAPDRSFGCLRTCNESGKTTVIIASFILWHVAMIPNGFCLSTAGVGRQVTHQLLPALHRHSGKFPSWKFLADGIEVKGTKRYLGFTTKQVGYFEGFHEHGPDAPLAIVLDEAKTVPKLVYDEVERCNPSRLLLASSTGGPVGGFYDACTKHAKLYQQWKLTVDDCPHIDRKSIERRVEKFGREHPLLQSILWAEFMGQEEGAIFNLAAVERAMFDPPDWNQEAADRHCFCDFAAGRDENVIALRVGNRVTIEDAWRDKNTMSAVGRFVMNFNRLAKQVGLRPEEIEGDADGLGKPMCDRLAEVGWPVTEFHGGGPARYEPHYFNLWSEVWCEGNVDLEKGRMVLPDDEDLRAQLVARKKKVRSDGLFQCELKEDMAKRGLCSPDRADAVLGAMRPGLRVRANFFDRTTAELPDEFLANAEVDVDVVPGMQV
ncbi:MAG: hypothetical protein AB1705_08580, partial [Verrucomicrobiota bacterium]